MFARLLVRSVFVVVFAAAAAAAPVGWRHDGSGSYPRAQPPLKWSEDKNVVWKTKLPGNSYGSPIVVGERIFVVSDPAELICVNAADGKILWQRSHALEDLYGADEAKKIAAEYDRLNKEKDRLRKARNDARGNETKQAELMKQLDALEQERHAYSKKFPPPPKRGGSGNSAATPVCDGNTLYALFSHGVMAAYSLDGAKRWLHYLEAPTISFGHASSPVLVDGKIIFHINDTFALDAQTGKQAWRVELTPRHATPVPMRVGNTSVVVSPGGAVLRVADGKVLLKDRVLETSECTPIVADGVLYVQSSRARALRLLPDGDDAVKLEKVWEGRLTGGRRTPSPVLHDGLLYGVTTRGDLDVLDARTGTLVYQKKLDLKQVYASATAAGERIYLGGTRGTTLVLAAGKRYQEVSRNELEGFGSCPVFLKRRMLLRTRQHLYCIEE